MKVELDQLEGRSGGGVRNQRNKAKIGASPPGSAGKDDPGEAKKALKDHTSVWDPSRGGKGRKQEEEIGLSVQEGKRGKNFGKEKGKSKGGGFE